METHSEFMRRMFGRDYIGFSRPAYEHDKRKRRAGITKNNRRGQSKTRRHMTRASRRRNRG